MTREQIIQALIESDQSFRFDEYFPSFLESIMREGFKGYHHMPDSELTKIYADRVKSGHIAPGLSECTDADIIAMAAAEGYTLTPEDCAEIRASSKVPGESVRAAIYDFLDSFER
jgi:hypothetical protein